MDNVRMTLNVSLITTLLVPRRIKSCTCDAVVGAIWLLTINTR